MGPFICRFLSVVNTTALHDPWLVESVDVGHWMREELYTEGRLKIIRRFSTAWRVGAPAPALSRGQLYLKCHFACSKK